MNLLPLPTPMKFASTEILPDGIYLHARRGSLVKHSEGRSEKQLTPNDTLDEVLRMCIRQRRPLASDNVDNITGLISPVQNIG